jgi:DNA polymerase I-like protein with 3'-5' exonuclease and polymerase domains
MEKKLAIRSMYRAPKGKVLCAFDLSAAEAWIVAYLSNDPNMKRELANGDIHSFSACGIFDIPIPPGEGKARYKGVVPDDKRYVGKKMNHAGNYRTSPFKIAEFINAEGIITVSLAEAKRFHAKWLSSFSLHSWWNEVDYIAQTTKTITTCYGFRRKFWGIYNDDLKKEMTAFEPQSTVASHMHGAIHPELGIEGGNAAILKYIVKPSKGEIRMCNTAHDSVMLEVPTPLVNEVVPQVISYLKRPIVIKGQEFTIPVDAEVGERWKEMEDWRGEH